MDLYSIGPMNVTGWRSWLLSAATSRVVSSLGSACSRRWSHLRRSSDRGSSNGTQEETKAKAERRQPLATSHL